MSEFPHNPIESTEEVKTTREKLLAFAKEKPPQDPEVRELLVQWLNETNIEENPNTESWEYADVAIMQSVMKYRLGFLSKEEVLEELEQVGSGLVGSAGEKEKELLERLYDLRDAINANTFI